MSSKSSAVKWVLAAGGLGVAGLLGLLTLLLIGMGTGIGGLFVGFILATLPVPFYTMLALWIDRYEKEPIWMLAMAFIWGATIAVFFSYVFNTLNSTLVGMVAGAAAANFAGAVLSAPFVEEISKGLVLFILFFWKKDEFDNVTDGIVYASMVGLGFAMTENIQYYGNALAGGGVAGSMVLFVLRGMISPFAHPLFTAMTGIGLGLARETNKPVLKFAAPVIGLGAAMFLHAMWNLSATIHIGAFFVGYLIIMVPAFLGTLGLVVFSLRREAKIIRANLQPYVQTGVVSAEDVDRLCSVTGRLGASMAALKSGGFAGWRQRGQFHSAASELAFHRWRVSRQISRGEHMDAARESEFVAQLRAFRAQTSVG